MKKLATAIAAIALIGTSAFAQAPPPPPAPVFSWPGFYGGLNMAVSFGRASNDFNYFGQRTDVLLVVDLDNSNRLAVMFEDKINAPLQPDQGERCRQRQRGEQGVRDGRWNRFTTCLCAPEGYLAQAKLVEDWSVTWTLT